jgi:hypothetical protein
MVWVSGNRVKVDFSTSIAGHLFVPPPAAAGTLNPDALAWAQSHVEFTRQFFYRTVPPDHGCVPRRAVGSSSKPPGTTQAPVGKKCDFGVSQNFDFAHDAVPAAVLALASAAGS